MRPFPVSVARTTPLDARTTETDAESLFGTQMLVPSNTGNDGLTPTVTVWRIAPPPSSLSSVLAAESVVQTFVPSKTTPTGAWNPAVTVETEKVPGTTPGVAIET